MSNEWELPPEFAMRLAGQDDEPFLWSLFCSARPELAQLHLPPEQLTQLLRHQFELQQRGYATQYPQAEHWIITARTESVGKIMLARSQSGIHIIDFIIAPAWRRKGVGRTILHALKAQPGGVLTLQVDRQNMSAKHFYHQLGFTPNPSTGLASSTHEFLEWRAR